MNPLHDRDPAFHDQPMGLLGPGLWRDLLAVVVALPFVGVATGVLGVGSLALVLGCAGAIGIGARHLEVQARPVPT